MPKTSSPGWNRVTLVPTASTRPATSWPRTRDLGARSPATMRNTYGMPAMKCQSPMKTLGREHAQKHAVVTDLAACRCPGAPARRPSRICPGRLPSRRLLIRWRTCRCSGAAIIGAPRSGRPGRNDRAAAGHEGVRSTVAALGDSVEDGGVADRSPSQRRCPHVPASSRRAPPRACARDRDRDRRDRRDAGRGRSGAVDGPARRADHGWPVPPGRGRVGPRLQPRHRRDAGRRLRLASGPALLAGGHMARRPPEPEVRSRGSCPRSRWIRATGPPTWR